MWQRLAVFGLFAFSALRGSARSARGYWYYWLALS
jgi:hypothetical protein